MRGGTKHMYVCSLLLLRFSRVRVLPGPTTMLGTPIVFILPPPCLALSSGGRFRAKGVFPSGKFSFVCSEANCGFSLAVRRTLVAWKSEVGVANAPGLLAAAGRDVDHSRLLVPRAIRSPPVSLAAPRWVGRYGLNVQHQRRN